GGLLAGGPPGGGPPGGGPPVSGRCPRGGGALSSAAATVSIGARCGVLGRVPSSAALTSSIGSRRPGEVSSVTGGKTVVNRSSGGIGRCVGPLRAGREGPRDRRSRLCLGAPPRAGPSGTSGGEGAWGPSLFTGRAGTVARCPGAARPPRRTGRACRTQDIRLDQVIPAAGPTHLHYVYRKLVEAGRQQDQLFAGAGRTRHRSQMLAEHPRHQRQLLFPADRA